MRIENRFHQSIDKKINDSMESFHFLRAGSLIDARITKQNIHSREPILAAHGSANQNKRDVILLRMHVRANGLSQCSAEAEKWLHARSAPKRGFISQKRRQTANCNICKASISSKGGNTSNMLKHIELVHNLNVRERCRVFDTLRTSSAVASAPSH